MSLFESRVQFQIERRTLLFALIVGALFEAFTLTIVGWNGHWLAHPQNVRDDSGFIEAQVFEVPQEARLTSAVKARAPVKPEATLSKVPNQGRVVKDTAASQEESNQTESGGSIAATHGPVAVYAPSPQIPSYLQDQDLHVSVVIDFLVSSLGHTTVRLVGSSGNEELDAIALETAKKWQFKPAEKEHQAIDSKVRLRVVFEVK